MKLKTILFMLCGAIALTVLPACEHERTITTTTEETTVTHPAATATETRTIRAY